MKIYRIIDDKGRLVVPKTLRDLCEIESGDVVLLEQHEEGLLIRTSQFIDLKNQAEKDRFEMLSGILNTLNTQEKQKLLKKLIEREDVE